MNPGLRMMPVLRIFSIFSLLSLCTGCSHPARRHPNVVIFLSDDQGWGDFSTTGNKNLTTANIDRLASEGAMFNNFYVSPVCSPTRAELLTGRYHPRSGVYGTSAGGERMDLDETTLAEVFKKAGYATAAFGKWHNGMQYPYHPNARGFDEFYGFCSGHWGNYFDSFIEHNGKIVRGEGYLANDLTNKAMAFIEANKGRPFLVYIPFNIPHSPMQVPDEWWRKFENEELEMRGTNSGAENLNHTRAALAMCENIDWNVGRVLDKLTELDLQENTIALYFNDNGPNGHRWNAGMKGIKGSTDEGGVRSPLFIKWPGTIPAGIKMDEIAGAIDLLPTLAELAGIRAETNHPLDGKSLVPLLLQKNTAWEDRLIFSHWNGRVSARSRQYRYDWQGNLFDMNEDPGQTRNLAADRPQIASWFKTKVEEWSKEVLTNSIDENRVFPVGHPDFQYTQLPARDAKTEGNIVRSNRFPNSSFFTHWTSTADKIIWDLEVLEGGIFEAEIYYTCEPGDEGSRLRLSFGDNWLETTVVEAHDSPLIGMENDRVPRMESYEKDFKPLYAGIIRLEKGRGPLILQALEIPGKSAMDFRLLMLTRKADE